MLSVGYSHLRAPERSIHRLVEFPVLGSAIRRSSRAVSAAFRRGGTRDTPL